MKKVFIVTLYGLFNYGNRLQNYALQEVLMSLDCNAITLIQNEQENVIKHLAKIVLIKKNNRIYIKKLSDYLREHEDRRRKSTFLSFTNQYIKTKGPSKSKKNAPSSSEIDAYIVGSDQVWYPINKKALGKYLLTNITPQKRIAYAASFGVEQLPPKWRETYASELKKFKAISVREQKGAEIVKDITGMDVPVVLDPTMLLSASHWRAIKTQVMPREKKYVLQYFIGPQSQNVYEEIEEMAKKENLEIIDIMDDKKNMDRKSPYYKLGPDCFLDLVDHAQFVFTDSFHGAVFSILFHVPFRIFERYLDDLNVPSHMESRIDTLLSKTGLTQCAREHRPPTEEEFAHADQLLEKEREFSMNFLRSALFDSTETREEN